MRYAAIKYNDVVDTEKGICVSFWAQGCLQKCPQCHNPSTWDFKGGIERSVDEVINEIIKAIKANNITRNFSILGGEPLAPRNINNTTLIASRVREAYPNIKIYLWTGYTLQYLVENNMANEILEKIDVLIDGPFIASQRDITLPLRGSHNQNVYKKDSEGKFYKTDI